MREGKTREAKEMIRSLLTSKGLGVLCTQGETGPHASLVAFAASRDLTRLFFVTPRATRKFANVTADARAALLVDSRSNREEDFRDAVAVTAVGTADETAGAARERALKMYLARHPRLAEFARSPACALVRLRVESYSLVQRFQKVTVLPVKARQ